jgi:methionine-rich copper-binding protein CopC
MKRVAIFFSSLLLLLTPTLSVAHTTLVSSDPAHDTTIDQWPDHFTLTFAEPLQILKGAEINKVSVTNAKVESLEGATTVDGAVLTVVVSPNEVDGPVLVNYRVVAADGHVLDGEYAFNYKHGAVTAPLTTQQPHQTSQTNHGTFTNLALIATSTTLIVIGLLFGLFAYRRKND